MTTVVVTESPPSPEESFSLFFGAAKRGQNHQSPVKMLKPFPVRKLACKLSIAISSSKVDLYLVLRDLTFISYKSQM